MIEDVILPNSPKIVIINRNFEKPFQVQNELKNMGTNGVIVEESGDKKYYPPHRILEIVCEEIKT